MTTVRATRSPALKFVRGFAVASLLTLPTLAAAQAATPTVSELERQTRNEPQSASAWVNLGQAYLAVDRTEDAKNAFLEAVALEYRNGDAHYGLGLVEYARGDYQAALFSFNEVTRLHPDRFDGHFNRAVTLTRLRQSEGAVEAFRDAIREAQPEATTDDLINTHLGLAGQLKRLERHAEAATAYGNALALRPDDVELAFLHAESQHAAGNGLEALPALMELEGRSSDHRVSALIADIYVSAGQNDLALRSLERALRRAEQAGLESAQANLFVQLGLLQKSLGRDGEAARAFERAVRADRNSWQAQYHLGVAYLESNQPEMALQVLQDATRLNSESGELHLALASAHDVLGNNERAIAHAEAAQSRLTDGRSITEASFIKGRALYRVGDYRRALDALERVVTERPDSSQAQLWTGLALYAAGDYRASGAYFERAAQLDPNSVEARVNLGAAYLASQRYLDAELVYKLLVQQNPNDAESLFNLGWALFSQGSREEARRFWTSALDLGFEAAGVPLREYY